MSASQLDDMTPREFAAAAEAYKSRMEYELEQKRQETYASALLISRFMWAKRVPPYEKVFGNGTKKDMTDEQMLEAAEALNAMFGGSDSRGGEKHGGC